MLLVFFKQKTAYEVRISDWSSDVCSSDLTVDVPAARGSLAVLSHARFPKAEPRLYIPPAEAGGTATLRLRQPEERHPNGRSTFSWDPASATATAATSEPESGAGHRLYNLLYPLHTGVLCGLTLRATHPELGREAGRE